MRLGYGVRLMPQPYNHPVRTAESVAVLDLISNGRVDFGTGRSATRAELEGFGIDPGQTRAMWREAIEHVVGCWTNEEYEFAGQYWQMPRRRVQPKPLQQPHPPIWGATTSEDGHRQVGELGLGLCSFAVGHLPRGGQAEGRHLPPGGRRLHRADCGPTCTTRRPPSPWRCAPTTGRRALDLARESFEWYPKVGARQIASVSEWMAERSEDLGTYSYAADMKQHSDDGSLDLLSLEYLIDANACVLGTPEECVEMCRRYQAADIDLLLCLVNPYNIPHEAVMETIELMGNAGHPQVRRLTVGGRSRLGQPSGVGAMPTMGSFRWMAPVDPKKPASPKLKIPPSAATSQ